MAESSFYLAGLDLGSERVRCAVGALNESGVRLLGYAEAESQGWAKGRVADQKAVTDSILRAVVPAEQMANVRAESLVVGTGGATVRGANSRAAIDLGRPREIEQRDVTRAVDRASRVQLHEDRMILHVALQDFVVDDHPGHRDPRNMVASRLEANVHVITTSILEHTCIVTAANQAHLEVDETVFEPMAACYAAVVPEERREGIALIDIGLHSTDMLVYYGDALQMAASLPICGDHLTRDVARGLFTSYEDADLLKREYGVAVAGLTAGNSFIEVPSAENREPREAPRRKLVQILEARAEELFRMVRRELARVGMDRALMGGVVLTGAGAKLAGMCDVAEKVLNCQARYGLATGIRDWPSQLADPEWTTVAGLMMYSAKLKAHHVASQQAMGLLGRLLK